MQTDNGEKGVVVLDDTVGRRVKIGQKTSTSKVSFAHFNHTCCFFCMFYCHGPGNAHISDVGTLAQFLKFSKLNICVPTWGRGSFLPR